MQQLEHALRFKLTELGIQGIILALSPYLTEQLAPATVHIVVPDLPPELGKLIPYRVREPRTISKALFPHGRRYSATLEILCHNGKYMGYAYLIGGNESLAVYDDVRELLSQALYKLYLLENRTKANTLVISDRESLIKKLPISLPLQETHAGKIQAQDILDYLIDHMDQICTLEEMADYFGLSKSHLARRIRFLTGYSMQTLHELLKISQAKDLIKGGGLKMHDIAARLGYTNPNYFSNVFKKVTGMSPLAWKKKNRR